MSFLSILAIIASVAVVVAVGLSVMISLETEKLRKLLEKSVEGDRP